MLQGERILLKLYILSRERWEEITVKIVYASRKGNVEALVGKFDFEAPLKLKDGQERVDEDFVIFFYNDGRGDMPKLVETFLDNNRAHLRGVVGSGSMQYHADTFNYGAIKASEKYNVPLLGQVDGQGNKYDVIEIRGKIKALG